LHIGIRAGAASRTHCAFAQPARNDATALTYAELGKLVDLTRLRVMRIVCEM